MLCGSGQRWHRYGIIDALLQLLCYNEHPISIALTQIVIIILRIHYIVYEDPEYDYIGMISDIFGIGSVLKYYLILADTNTFIINILIVPTIWFSIKPPKELALVWQQRIFEIIKELKSNSFKSKIISIAILSYLLKLKSSFLFEQLHFRKLYEIIEKKNQLNTNSKVFLKKLDH